jgi:hypothetical protein
MESRLFLSLIPKMAFSLESPSAVSALHFSKGASVDNDARLKLYCIEQNHYPVRVADIPLENNLNPLEYTVLHYNLGARGQFHPQGLHIQFRHAVI